MLAAPTAVQQTFVKKIISVDTSPASVVLNVPDSMAPEIPPYLLVFSEETVDTKVINNKTWTRDQVSVQRSSILCRIVKDVQKDNCRSYFSALGAADFSVASEILNKGPLLLNEARTCLGINGTSLSRDNVEVLGNMACTMNGSYIQNAHPLILEKLKACKDFSDSQVAAMETLLLTGKSQYGSLCVKPVSVCFLQTTKRNFLKIFMPKLRKTKTEKRKLKMLFKQISNRMISPKSGKCCTVGNITQVTVSDASFPFRYDQTQFDLCLDITVLKDNLNSICEKVADEDFHKIILQKLHQAFPSGVSDQDVQVLGSVSRMASLDDISKWNISRIDTLAALMKAEDGSWEAAKSKEIITKYLSTSGKSLGSIELNVIGSNLCSLNTSTLKTISPDSIRNASALNVESCSAEQKSVLYHISHAAFHSQTGNPSIFYNLIKSCLGLHTHISCSVCNR
uniref:Si:ch211-188p14.4 n=1 Tax=Stegastes partitus TaxID=144197 RepID=A0A3B4ZGZ8_9TELE